MPLISALAIAAVLAVFVTRNASGRVDRYGRSPWGWPVPVWAIMTLLFGFVAVLVYWLATRRQDKTSSPELAA